MRHAHQVRRVQLQHEAARREAPPSTPRTVEDGDRLRDQSDVEEDERMASIEDDRRLAERAVCAEPELRRVEDTAPIRGRHRQPVIVRIPAHDVGTHDADEGGSDERALGARH